MKVVRRATPGTRSRMRPSSRSYFWRRAGASHALEHRVRRVLKRKVDILADLLALRHGGERVVVDRRRIQVKQANPFEAVNLVQHPQQPRQRPTFVAVDPVKRRVLRDEQQLLDPAIRQRARLADDRLGGPAAVAAAQRRDDAEGALVIAPFSDLDVRVMPGRGEHPRCLGVVHVGRRRAAGRGPSEKGERRAARGREAGDGAHDLRHLAGAEHGVDLRDLGTQLVAVALGKAPGHDQAAARAVFLVPRHLQDRINRFLFRRVDEGAGVDDEHVGRGLVLDKLMPCIPRQTEHHLGVDEILRAAEGNEPNLHRF